MSFKDRLAEAIINQVFAKGVGSVRKEALEAAFERFPKKVYRVTSEPEKLMEEGFVHGKGAPFASQHFEEFMHQKGIPIEEIRQYQARKEVPKELWEEFAGPRNYIYDTPQPEFDIPGLYWFDQPPNRGMLPAWNKSGEVVEGIPRPDALVRQIPAGEDWSKMQEQFDVADLIKRSTIGDEELIQRAPGNVLAKWGDKYRIIGLAGAMGMGSALIPDEAEANPFKWVGKVGKAVSKGLQSRTAKVLEGRVLPQYEEFGKVVDVIKAPGDKRILQFESGKEIPVSKDVVAELVVHYRTQEYVGKLDLLDESGQYEQALKSLDFHRVRQKPFTTKAMKTDWLKNTQETVGLMGETRDEYVYIRTTQAHAQPGRGRFVNEPFECYMPKRYAEILEAAGDVKILGKGK